MRIPVKTKTGGYEITLERGAMKHAGEILNLDRNAVIVTDDGVPEQYAKTIAAQCKQCAHIVTLPQGEKSKCIENFIYLLKEFTRVGLTRTDCAVAVGGGVVGDLTGFACACYMRGIDFYNIPTTVLSQVDSSIGGKTAIDFEGYKNIVGAFYPPCAVIIDPDTLDTLPRRQIANGLAESVKMALTFDSALFEQLESDNFEIDDVIYRSLLIKKQVVEKDELESGLRRALNFGHTLAHAVESESAGALYHGECVAIGMVPMCCESVRKRLVPVLKRLGLPIRFEGKAQSLQDAMEHDKKKSDGKITVIFADRIGGYEMRQMNAREILELAKKAGAV